MKKILCFVLALMLLVSITACAKEGKVKKITAQSLIDILREHGYKKVCEDDYTLFSVVEAYNITDAQNYTCVVGEKMDGIVSKNAMIIYFEFVDTETAVEALNKAKSGYMDCDYEFWSQNGKNGQKSIGTYYSIAFDRDYVVIISQVGKTLIVAREELYCRDDEASINREEFMKLIEKMGY